MPRKWNNGKVYILIVCLVFSLLWGFNRDVHPETRYSFSELFTIGIEEAKEEKDKPYQFYNIMSIDCDKEGNFYVLDFTGNCVKKFDSTGKFIKKFFQRGKGPTEIANPISISINRYNDHMFILQDFGFTMKEFDLNGNYIKYHVLPRRSGVLIHFLDNEKCVGMNSTPKEETFNNFHILNVVQKKIVKEFAPVKMSFELNFKQYFSIGGDSVLWTSRGNEMKLLAFDLNSGAKLREIKIPGKYKSNKLLKIAVTKDSGISHPILYNIAQPFVIDEQLFVLVVIQDYKEKSGKVEKYPSHWQRTIYQVQLENNHFIKLGTLENGSGMYAATVSKNKLVLFSNDPFGRFKVLEFKKL